MGLDDHASDPFWVGLDDGEFRIQRCRECGRASFPPAPVCQHCQGEHLEWDVTEGRGTVYAFTRQHRTAPGYDSPIVLGTIELREDVRLLARIDAPYEELGIGTPVELEPVAYDGPFDRGRLADRPFFVAVPRGGVD